MQDAMQQQAQNLALVTIVLTTLAVSSTVLAQTKIAFATSVRGTGDLSTWADSQGLDGLAGADTVCQQRATAAGLPDASSFVAWLSTEEDDAYCRVQGLEGKRASQCDGFDDKGEGGPWVRVDGRPFLASIELALAPNYQVFYPPVLDEFGDSVFDPEADASEFVVTATALEGAFRDRTDCDGWASSSSALQVLAGEASATGLVWMQSRVSDCGSSSRLVCMQQGQGDALPPFALEGRVAFVTAAGYPGRFQDAASSGGEIGIDGADNICVAEATSAGFDHPSTFKAWLSDTNTDAASRFMFNGPWVRPDGVKIANGLADLTAGTLSSAISETSTGQYLFNHGAWTGAMREGAASAENCFDWTSSDGAAQGGVGSASRTSYKWDGWYDTGCNFGGRLYCLSDRLWPEIFEDGFETGTLAAWHSP